MVEDSKDFKEFKIKELRGHKDEVRGLYGRLDASNGA
jgi:hypothetical protein